MYLYSLESPKQFHFENKPRASHFLNLPYSFQLVSNPYWLKGSYTLDMEDISNYENLRRDTGVWFQTLKPTHSPALNELVHFTSEGFEHIVYKRARAERERSSQVMRFKLLPRAVTLIGLSTTFQEYEETAKQFEVKRHKKRLMESKLVRYWGMIAIIENRKIKVIIRKIGNGKLHFWSIIPAWTTNKYRDTKFVSTMKGSPEED